MPFKDEKKFDDELGEIGNLYEEGKDLINSLQIIQDEMHYRDRLYIVIERLRTISAVNLKAVHAFALNNNDRPAMPTNARMHSEMVRLSKREYFSAMAMQGLSANSNPGSHHEPKNLIYEAIELSDELLKQLES